MFRVLRDETSANLDRWFLWSPVWFGLGAAAYLEAPVEPSLLLLALLTGSGVALW